MSPEKLFHLNDPFLKKTIRFKNHEDADLYLEYVLGKETFYERAFIRNDKEFLEKLMKFPYICMPDMSAFSDHNKWNQDSKNLSEMVRKYMDNNEISNMYLIYVLSHEQFNIQLKISQNYESAMEQHWNIPGKKILVPDAIRLRHLGLLSI